MMASKQGDLMLFQYWGRVKQDHGHDLVVENVDNGTRFNVNGKKLIDDSLSADKFVQTEKVSKTELAERLVHSKGAPLTVVFTKQSGEKRTLRGRLMSSEALLGRSHVEDLDLGHSENRLRLVDHRTLESLIVGGVKYILK